MPSSRTRRLAAVAGGAVVALVLAAGAAVGGYATTSAVRDPAPARDRPRSPVPAPVALATGVPATGGTSAPAPVPATAPSVAGALAGVLSAPGLGSRIRVDVRDVATGATVYSRDPSAPTAPASTAKLLTAAAILTVHAATDRLTTAVVAGADGTVVLVGGGDPTLTCAAAGRAGAYPDAARISDLAGQLRRARVDATRVVVDDSLYSGPSVSPAWAAEDIPSSYATPETAVMCDGGRDAPGDVVRSTAPDLAAGRALASALGRPGLPVTRGTAPSGARRLASVRSAPIGTLVAQMLQNSDNVIAESLGRQVALSLHRAASFTEAVIAVRSVLSTLGVDVGTGMRDASGLAASDRLSAATLTSVVRLAAGTAHPALHAVIAALPVAAWSGTLTDRYVTGGTRTGAGLVRAKTGTLTGVSTLAGVVHDSSGRQLAFTLMADRTGATPSAEAALDAVAARLAGCGCR